MKNGMVTIKRSNKLGVGEHLVEINSIDYKKSSKSGLKLVQIEVQCVKTKREGIFLFPLSSNSNYPLSDQLIDAIYIDENKDEIDGDELEGKRIIIRVVSKKGYLNIESFKSSFEYSEDEFDDYNNENHDELNYDDELEDDELEDDELEDDELEDDELEEVEDDDYNWKKNRLSLRKFRGISSY